MPALVESVSRSQNHSFSKSVEPVIRLVPGRGVEGDAHFGENITTRGVDVLSLPRGTRLYIGKEAVVELTGLRNPCVQIDRFQQGLLNEVLGRDANGALVRKAGVMSIVLVGGDVAIGDEIRIELPPPPHPYDALAPV